jgi:hypothetical protein
MFLWCDSFTELEAFVGIERNRVAQELIALHSAGDRTGATAQFEIVPVLLSAERFDGVEDWIERFSSCE